MLPVINDEILKKGIINLIDKGLISKNINVTPAF